jgi:hypothetical protein
MQKQNTKDDWFYIFAEHKTSGNPKYNWRCLPSEIERIKKEKIATAFRIWIDPTQKDIDTCLEGEDYAVMVDFWIHMPRLKDFAERHNLPLNKYVDDTVTMLLEYMKKYGNRVWWTIYGEHDNHIKLPRKFGSRKEVYEYAKALMTSSLAIEENVYFPGAGSDADSRYNGMPQPFEYLKSKGIDINTSNIAIQCGLGSSSHHIYEWGPSLIWMETNASLPNLQVELAFLCGAARQYDKFFGVDVSAWGIPLGIATIYDTDGTCYSGVHPSLQARQMLVAFLTGANMIHQEVTEVTFWIDKKIGLGMSKLGHDPAHVKMLPGIDKFNEDECISDSNKEWFELGERDLELSPVGKVSKAMVEFTKRYPELRKHPYRPIGLLMEYYHGWSQIHSSFSEVCYGNTKFETGDYMVKNFFGAAFPGCYTESTRGIDHLWEQNLTKSNELYTEIKADFFSEHVKLIQDGFDFRTCNNIELVSSRWGDVFDVMLENADEQAFAKYPLFFLLGRIIPPPQLEEKLWNYVENGGVVIASVANLRKEFLDKIGVSVEKQVIIGTTECRVCGRRHAEELFRPYKIYASNSTCLVQSMEGLALLLELKLGKGKFIIGAAPYFLTGNGNSMLNGYVHAFDHIFSSIMPVEVHGPPVQWLVNTPSSSTVVTLINNSSSRWNGKLSFNASKATRAQELWTETEINITRTNEKVETEIAVEPFGFKVIRIS